MITIFQAAKTTRRRHSIVLPRLFIDVFPCGTTDMDIGHNEGALPQPGPTLRRPSSGKPELGFHHARLVEGQTWNTGTADKLTQSAQVYLDFGRGKSGPY
jgi:hypothetical protein